MGVSIKPSEMVEGGAPVDRNMLIKSAKYVLFNYTKKDGTPTLDVSGKPAQSVSAELVLVEDDGSENQQNYSVGDPNRYEIAADGKTLGPDGITISKSCNFHILMNGIVNAGFPENKLGDSIGVLEGLYAFWIGVPEPKRSGLARTPEQEARVRQIPVPSVIHKLPWEKAKPGQKPSSGATGATGNTPEGSDDILSRTVSFIGSLVEASGSVTRQDAAQQIFADAEMAKDPQRDAIAQTIFLPALQAALLAKGFAVTGETITKLG